MRAYVLSLLTPSQESTKYGHEHQCFCYRTSSSTQTCAAAKLMRPVRDTGGTLGKKKYRGSPQSCVI